MALTGVLLGCPGDGDLANSGTESADAGSSSTAATSGAAASSTADAASQTAATTNDPSNPATTKTPTETASASDTVPETETASASASESSSNSASGSGSSSSSSTGGPPEGSVQFIAFGDGGEGNDAQYAVAAIVEQVCQDRGCQFALYLGDNFYDVGVDSTMDVQFTDKFEMPYADVTDMPFYITLGNHDYGQIGNEWYKSQFQVEYTEFSDKWTLPSEFYTFDAGGVTFISLDTAQLFWDHGTDEMRDFLRATLLATKNDVTVAFGHHPYVSNGQHGNAGNYEGLPLPLIGGGTVEDFFDEEICGKVQLYFSGHDHNRQWHPQTCGTTFIVTGAAAKTTDFVNRDNNPNPLFQDDTTPGFAWVQIDGKAFTLAFYDQTGAMNFENTITLP